MTRPGSTYVAERDATRLDSQYERVKACVLGGPWLTLSLISASTGYPEASVSARLREMRAKGYIVQRKYIKNGLHEYRVFHAMPQPLALLGTSPCVHGGGGRTPASATKTQGVR